MKRPILALAALLVSSFSFAQFNVETQDGDPITDGSTYSFNSLDEADALSFFVNNESSTDPINVKIEFVDAVNYDGSDMQLCFGLCYDPISEGSVYPPGNEVVTIAPNSNQGNVGDKFWNYNDGGGAVIEYNFKFFLVDGSGNPTGDELSFTYKYDPFLNIEDQNLVQARLLSSVVSSQLSIETNEDINVKVYNILGALVTEADLNVGTSNVNVSQLDSQVYLVQITNSRGATSVHKIVKR